MINVSARWLTQHRAAYQAWAASESGAAMIARATLAAPSALRRSPLTPSEERRILVALDAGASREAQLLLERGEAAAELQQLRAETRRERQQSADLREEAAVERRAAAAARADVAALRRRLAAVNQGQRRELRAARARRAAARAEAASLRQRLISAERRQRCEFSALSAVLAATQTAELAAARAAAQSLTRFSRARPPLLREHLRRAAAGHNTNDTRRTAQRLLHALF